MEKNIIEPFKKDKNGTIIGLANSRILMPAHENPYKMQFGGEVLKSFDEESGLLAGMFFGAHALHVSESVVFIKPVYTGHVYIQTFQVIKAHDGFVTMLGCVRSQEIGNPELSTDIRYAGVAIAAMVDKKTAKIIRDKWISAEMLEAIEEMFRLQKKFRKLLT